MNPMAAKFMGGAKFREQLRDALLDKAAKTDDPAYAARLREVADGRRPLRTLMHDPAFAAEMQPEPVDQAADHPLADLLGDAKEVAAQVNDRLRAQGVTPPSAEEAKAMWGEAQALREQSEAVVREENLTGWGGSVERLEWAAKPQRDR